jgi:hypothetical protein
MGVLAVIAVIVIWRLAVKGKGNPAARLAAWLCAVVVALVLVDIQNPHSAGMVASGFATGISQAASGLGRFLGKL